MLRKLLKHEFRATGRVMLPLYAVLLVLAVGANLAARSLLGARLWFWNMLGGFLIFAFGIAVTGVCVVSVVLMVYRFKRNLLSDEGYVMMTLPVSVHQQVWSKLIVSAVWFALTFAAVAFSSVLMVSGIAAFKELVQYVGYAVDSLRVYGFDLVGIGLELVGMLFLMSCVVCLMFYAALAAGHGFSGHKTLWSIAFFFGLQFAVWLLLALVANVPGLSAWDYWLSNLLGQLELHGMAAVHAGMLLVDGCILIYGAIFYFITTYCLKKHLNLE